MYSSVSGMYLTCILALVGVRPEYIQDTRDTLTLLWYSCIPRPFGRPSHDTYRYTPDTHPIHIHTTVPRPGHRYIHDTYAIHQHTHVCHGGVSPRVLQGLQGLAYVHDTSRYRSDTRNTRLYPRVGHMAKAAYRPCSPSRMASSSSSSLESGSRVGTRVRAGSRGESTYSKVYLAVI